MESTQNMAICTIYGRCPQVCISSRSPDFLNMENISHPHSVHLTCPGTRSRDARQLAASPHASKPPSCFPPQTNTPSANSRDKIHPTLGQLDSWKEQKPQPSAMALGWIVQNCVYFRNYKPCPQSFTQPYPILCSVLLELTPKILAHS